jgi:hypothetical protein
MSADEPEEPDENAAPSRTLRAGGRRRLCYGDGVVHNS